MLTRKVERDIINWIQNSEKGLLVYGVRQAGKTYIIRKCLEECGCDYVEFNLIQQPEVVTILEKSTSVNDLILRLQLLCDKKITPNETFIFFDEIQKYKEIVTKIKFLVEDRRYRYVLSGSLLGIEIVNIKSAPVGYLTSITMYPLDFEEFLQIYNAGEELINKLKQAYKEKKPIDDIIHNRLLQLFNMYLIIGGMPAAIEKYRETSNINTVIEEHLSIIEQYRLDFTQYEVDNKKLIISQIYDLIPSEINSKNKRFSVASISKNLRYDRVQDSFVWLWKAGAALPVFNTTEPTIPLMINKKSTLFKLFLSDVGLLTTIYGKATKLAILNNESNINKGAVYENAVAQELTAHNYAVYYYNSNKFGELDFLIEQNGRSLPIEVKSGKEYERHSALNNVLLKKEYEIKEALVFANCNIKVVGNITYYPIYMAMFLQENDIDFGDISVSKLSF